MPLRTIDALLIVAWKPVCMIHHCIIRKLCYFDWLAKLESSYYKLISNSLEIEVDFVSLDGFGYRRYKHRSGDESQ